MYKLTLVFSILYWSSFSALSQDKITINPVYYFIEDSVSLNSIFKVSELSCDSSNLLGYFTTFIVNKHGKNITGWVLVQKKNYLIARQVIDGKQNGFEIQYQRIKNEYVLRSIQVYSNDNLESLIFSIDFDYKKLKYNSNVSDFVERYRIYNQNSSNSNLVSTEVVILSDKKQKEINHRFYKASNFRSKSKNKNVRNDTLLLCHLESYSITKIAKIIELNNLTNVFQQLW